MSTTRMTVRKFETMEEWFAWRLGKVTGSRAKDVMKGRDGGIKSEAYRAAAESLIGTAALAEEELTSAQILERGHVLEREALKRFTKETGKKLDSSLQGWEREDDPRLAISPDASVTKTAAVEAKCLLSPKHIEALYTRAIPKNTAGYEEQMLHYFIVNPQLKTLYYVFYHPDFPEGLDFFFLTFTRKELAEKIAAQEAAELDAVRVIRDIVNVVSLYGPEEAARMRRAHEELVQEDVREKAKAAKKVSAK